MEPADCRVLLLVPGVHFYAPLTLRRLLSDYPEVQYHALLTPKVDRSEGLVQGLWKIGQTSGWRYLAAQAGLSGLYTALNGLEKGLLRSFDRRGMPTVRDVLGHHDVGTSRVTSIRSQRTRKIVTSWSPSLVVAVFFNQWVPEWLRELPRLGSYNLHPGALPDYRGFSPVFWQLYHDEPRAFCSLHGLTEALDEGPVVDSAAVPVHDGDSFFSLYRRLARAGGELVANLVGDVLREHSVVAETVSSHREGSDPHPRFQAHHVRTFYRRGRRFWRWKHLLESVCSTTGERLQGGRT